ncbi:unnamed protein product [Moneuplotes crassus]|uniref:Uncharacterized protein n=1 Tax=Euplotes crassus TaxID=5936 RepID=A0AAD1ULA2_EUPCR|nr:unnamed protein product [Moneuplotes crassus]
MIQTFNIPIGLKPQELEVKAFKGIQDHKERLSSPRLLSPNTDISQNQLRYLTIIQKAHRLSNQTSTGFNSPTVLSRMLSRNQHFNRAGECLLHRISTSSTLPSLTCSRCENVQPCNDCRHDPCLCLDSWTQGFLTREEPSTCCQENI